MNSTPVIHRTASQNSVLMAPGPTVRKGLAANDERERLLDLDLLRRRQLAAVEVDPEGIERHGRVALAREDLRAMHAYLMRVEHAGNPAEKTRRVGSADRKRRNVGAEVV